MVNWKGFLFLSFILDPHVYLWFCTFISLLFYALMNVRSTKGSTFIFSDIVLHNKSKWMEKKEKTIFNSWIWRPISCIQEEIIFEPAILHSFSTVLADTAPSPIALPGQLAIPRAGSAVRHWPQSVYLYLYLEAAAHQPGQGCCTQSVRRVPCGWWPGWSATPL